jgi:hypothetical protein
LLEIRAIDREGEIRLGGEKALDVGERGVLQLDQKLLTIIRRDQVDGNRKPSALRLSMRMPRKLRNSSVDIARITSGLLESAVSPCGIPDLSS